MLSLRENPPLLLAQPEFKAHTSNVDIYAKFEIWTFIFWPNSKIFGLIVEQYLHWPSFGGLHSKQSQHSGRHVVVMEHLPFP